jgi:hypothetical protein
MGRVLTQFPADAIIGRVLAVAMAVFGATRAKPVKDVKIQFCG